MKDQRAGAPPQFEALTNSAHHLNQLKIQLKEAQKKHASLFNEVLDAAEGDPPQLSFGIIHQGKMVAGGPLNMQLIGMLRALNSAMGHIPPGEGAGCPDKVGCANIGQLGDHCYYLCLTVKR
jgi:hypothetical protein